MVAAPAHNKTRVAARLANAFILDLAKLGGFGRDVIDGLLLMAISQANVAPITRTPALQRAYATLDQPPPDHLRRPVSISAIANSLRIPFETARRRITSLIDLGIVRALPKGVVVPQGSVDSPFYRMGATANYALVRDLYFRLRAIGFLDELPRPNGPGFDPDNPPIRLVMRLSSDYLLRLAEPLSRYIGDLVSALVLMETIHANTEHLPDSEGGADDLEWSADGFVDDALRGPVRAAVLSQRLGIPPETVRRHLNRMVTAGVCVRTKAGFLVPSRLLAHNGYVRYMMDNQSHLYRLFYGLADLGVVSEWEREILRLRGAA